LARRMKRKSDSRKAKSKEWYKIIGPDMFGKSQVGETVSSDPKSVVGRIIETTLGELTNNFSKQNIKLKFKVNQIAGDSAYTKFVGHELTSDYVRSLVKRRTSRIDTITDVITSDGYRVRVKPSCFTVKRAKTTQVKSIREVATRLIQEKAKTMDLAQFIQEIVLGRLSLDIYKNAKAIYPLRRVEIRKTEVIGEPVAA